MKTFKQWAEEYAKTMTDAPAGEPSTEENTKRSGISKNYPDAYVRSQYPDNYYMPITSTAKGKLDGKMA